MKIVIAPDSYKESLSAMDVATQIEAGFREIYPDAEYVKLPVADGGEGTVQSFIQNSGENHLFSYAYLAPLVIISSIVFPVAPIFA